MTFAGRENHTSSNMFADNNTAVDKNIEKK